MFFGVTEPTRHLWQQAKAAGRDWYYLDDSLFDISRGRMFRASRNAVQATGLELPDWGRWAALGLKVQPWRKHGRHVIIAAQSQTHMSVVAGQRSSWWRDAFTILQAHTDREIVVRGWRSNKMALASSLAESLRDCWALVTWSSAAAIEAVLAGVPVFLPANARHRRWACRILQRSSRRLTRRARGWPRPWRAGNGPSTNSGAARRGERFTREPPSSRITKTTI